MQHTLLGKENRLQELFLRVDECENQNGIERLKDTYEILAPGTDFFPKR